MCKLYPNNLEDLTQKVITFRSRKDGECTNFEVKAFNKDACRAACIRMIINDELSFTHVEEERFRKFCAEIFPKFDLPSRKIFARDVYNLYLAEKKKLRSYLKNNGIMGNLTMDTHISIQNIN